MSSLQAELESVLMRYSAFIMKLIDKIDVLEKDVEDLQQQLREYQIELKRRGIKI